MAKLSSKIESEGTHDLDMTQNDFWNLKSLMDSQNSYSLIGSLQTTFAVDYRYILRRYSGNQQYDKDNHWSKEYSHVMKQLKISTG